jgi:hypothetical protein
MAITRQPAAALARPEAFGLRPTEASVANVIGQIVKPSIVASAGVKAWTFTNKMSLESVEKLLVEGVGLTEERAAAAAPVVLKNAATEEVRALIVFTTAASAVAGVFAMAELDADPKRATARNNETAVHNHHWTEPLLKWSVALEVGCIAALVYIILLRRRIIRLDLSRDKPLAPSSTARGL